MELSTKEIEELEMLREMLISPVVIALLRLQCTYVVETDVGRRQVWCVRLQKQRNGHNKLIS